MKCHQTLIVSQNLCSMAQIIIIIMIPTTLLEYVT